MKRHSAIQEEIRQTRPFRTRASEAFVALLRTAHVLHRRIEALGQSEGLTSQQYNVLRILRGARGPLPTMEIAERLIEPAPGITRLVGTLEARGLLRREQWAGDRRCVLCQITPAGLKLLERLDEPVEQLDVAMMSALSEEQLEQFVSYLDAIRRANADPESHSTQRK